MRRKYGNDEQSLVESHVVNPGNGALRGRHGRRVLGAYVALVAERAQLAEYVAIVDFSCVAGLVPSRRLRYLHVACNKRSASPSRASLQGRRTDAREVLAQRLGQVALQHLAVEKVLQVRLSCKSARSGARECDQHELQVGLLQVFDVVSGCKSASRRRSFARSGGIPCS